MTGDELAQGSRLKRRSYLLSRITFSLSRGYYNFVYHLIKDKCASVNELPSANNWLSLETSKINKEFLDGKSALILCAYLKESDVRISMARMLIENGAKLNMTNPKNGCNALHYACALLCFELIEYYLNSMDFDLSLVDFHGNTPLFYLIISLHLCKLTKAKISAGHKMITLYLQISKHYLFNVNPTNRFGMSLINLCKLIGNREIYELIKSALNGTLSIIKLPFQRVSEINESPKTEYSFENTESISIKSVKNAALKSDRSSSYSFLDEIVNFKKWSKPLIKSSKAVSSGVDNPNIIKLRTTVSTPIARTKKSVDKIDEEFGEKTHAQLREIEAILKKHLLIEINEIKYKRIDYAKEADEKLVKIYINRLSGFDDSDIYCLNHNLKTDVVTVKPEFKQHSLVDEKGTQLRTARSTHSLSQPTHPNDDIKIYRSRSAVQLACIEEKNNYKDSTIESIMHVNLKSARAQSANVLKLSSRKATTPTKIKKKCKKIEAKFDSESLGSDAFRTERSSKMSIHTPVNSNRSISKKLDSPKQDLEARVKADQLQESQSQKLQISKQIQPSKLNLSGLLQSQTLSSTQLAVLEGAMDKKSSQEDSVKKKQLQRFNHNTTNVSWKEEFQNFYENFESTCTKSFRKGIKPVFEELKSSSIENYSENKTNPFSNENKTFSSNNKTNESKPLSSITNKTSGNNKTIEISALPHQVASLISVQSGYQRASGWINNPHNPHNHISYHK